MTTQTPVSITVTLTPDHVQALAAMVELGTADRREFLAKYAKENDYTSEAIAQGHYEADCADDAVIALADALAAIQNVSKPLQTPAPEQAVTPDQAAACIPPALMDATTETELVSLWKQFCAVANLPCLSADELLADEGNIKDRLLISERRWITQFIKRWEAVVG